MLPFPARGHRTSPCWANSVTVGPSRYLVKSFGFTFCTISLPTFIWMSDPWFISPLVFNFSLPVLPTALPQLQLCSSVYTSLPFIVHGHVGLVLESDCDFFVLLKNQTYHCYTFGVAGVCQNLKLQSCPDWNSLA